MPLLARDNDRFFRQKYGQSKIKCTFSLSHHLDPEFEEVKNRKCRNSLNSNKSNTHSNPDSPNLQHIIINHPILNMYNEHKFNHDNAMTTCETLDNTVISSVSKPVCNIIKIPRSYPSNC